MSEKIRVGEFDVIVRRSETDQISTECLKSTLIGDIPVCPAFCEHQRAAVAESTERLGQLVLRTYTSAADAHLATVSFDSAVESVCLDWTSWNGAGVKYLVTGKEVVEDEF